MEIVTLRHTPEQVQRSRAELLSARETIDTSNDVLAAAGLLMEALMHYNASSPPAKQGNEHGGVKTASVIIWPDNPRKLFLHCEGKFRINKAAR